MRLFKYNTVNCCGCPKIDKKKKKKRVLYIESSWMTILVRSRVHGSLVIFM